MSGSIGYEPKDRLAKMDQILAEYTSKLGADEFEQIPSEIKGYLSMGREELRGLSDQDRDDIAYILGGTAYNIQRAYNTELSRVNWAEENIKKIICSQLEQYQVSKYTPFEEKRLMAIRGDDVANKFHEIKMYAQLRADRLHDLSRRVEFMSRILQQARRVYGKA